MCSLLNQQRNGCNLLKLQARDVYAYGRALLDILFTKEEQKHSVVYESKKTTKPGLELERVELLFGNY